MRTQSVEGFQSKIPELHIQIERTYLQKDLIVHWGFEQRILPIVCLQIKTISEQKKPTIRWQEISPLSSQIPVNCKSENVQNPIKQP